MLARVGFEMACVEAAARGTIVVVLLARRAPRRSEVAGVRIIVTYVLKKKKKTKIKRCRLSRSGERRCGPIEAVARPA